MIAADKNIEFVCMDIDDYLSQYEKINLQQHFGQVNISESCYIEYIFNFLMQAATHIPHKMSLLVKTSGFFVDKSSCFYRVLRLMPKILKMKTISRSHLPNLTSQSIKSALPDPIKAVQKSLDKIYSHLLHYIEQAFNSKFNLL